MTSYLLTTKALYEFVSGERSPCDDFRQWYSELLQSDRLHASEISLGELRTSIEAFDDLQTRKDWREIVEEVIPRQFGTRLLPFTGSAVSEWGLIRLSGNPPLPAEETMVIGQALAGELVLVGPKTNAHQATKVTMLDPYNGTGWPGEEF